MRIALVVAMARNRVIGRDNALPWRLPSDLAYFKRVTLGHPVVMGRRTFESIGKPLAGRKNIVITRNPRLLAPGCIVVHSLDAAWDPAAGADEAFVIGGPTPFGETPPTAPVVHLSAVEPPAAGRTVFPALDRAQSPQTEVERHGADERQAY